MDADNCTVCPTVDDTDTGLTVTPVALICPFVTVSVLVAATPPIVAVMVAVPFATATTLPFWSTVATDVLLLDHVAPVTALPVELTTLSCMLSPHATLAASGVSE